MSITRTRPGLSSSLELGAMPSAVPSARLHTRAVLSEWGLAELSDDAESVVTELTANAVEAHHREHRDEPVRLTLIGGTRTVLIVVTDRSSRPPVMNSPDAGCDAESGRGLPIVDALATRWDWKPAPGAGKAVRAVVTAGPDPCHPFAT